MQCAEKSLTISQNRPLQVASKVTVHSLCLGSPGWQKGWCMSAQPSMLHLAGTLAPSTPLCWASQQAAASRHAALSTPQPAGMLHLARRVARPPGEGDDLTDVLQAGGKQQQALKAEAKPAVRHGAVLQAHAGCE